MEPTSPGQVEMLRHAVATLAYRAAKVVRGVGSEFGGVRVCPATRSAAQIVAHMGDLIDWATRAADGRREWRDSPAGGWDAEVARFFAALAALDTRLAASTPVHDAARILQGPVADALTHVGQLATLRKFAGAGVRGESYFRADIHPGRVGPDQPPPAAEWD
jgi:hypothetical protein